MRTDGPFHQSGEHAAMPLATSTTTSVDDR